MDGLQQDLFGLVWCNPPYGSETGLWLDKCAEHKNGIALVFARTSTKWFHRIAPTADLICFINKRLKFINAKTMKPAGSASADSMFLAWGGNASQVVLQSNLGLCFKGIEVK